jgi:hypothetical protein
MNVRRGWLRYVFAAAVTLPFVPLASALGPVIGLPPGAMASIPLVLPVIFSSWFGGRGPGLFAVATAAAGFAFFDQNPGGVARAILFSAVATVVVYLADRLWAVNTRAAYGARRRSESSMPGAAPSARWKAMRNSSR